MIITLFAEGARFTHTHTHSHSHSHTHTHTHTHTLTHTHTHTGKETSFTPKDVTSFTQHMSTKHTGTAKPKVTKLNPKLSPR